MTPSKWRTWSYFPWINWMAWIHAAIRTGKRKYYAYAGIYGIPFAAALMSGPHLPSDLTGLAIVSWLGGIVHAQARGRGVDREILANREQVRIRKNLNQILLDTAEQNRGILTLARAAQVTGQPVEELRLRLESFVKDDIAGIHVSAEGMTYFTFPGLSRSLTSAEPDALEGLKSAALPPAPLPDAPPKQTAASSIVAVRLKTLAQLLEEGLIDEKEHAVRRAEILREI